MLTTFSYMKMSTTLDKRDLQEVSIMQMNTTFSYMQEVSIMHSDVSSQIFQLKCNEHNIQYFN
jgi:hypothetical protein